jgi:hypothetical protein
VTNPGSETGKQFLVSRILQQAEREGKPLSDSDLAALLDPGARADLGEEKTDDLEIFWCELLNRGYAFERGARTKQEQRDIQKKYRHALCELADEDRWLWEMLDPGAEAAKPGQVTDALAVFGCALLAIAVLFIVTFGVIILWEKVH